MEVEIMDQSYKYSGFGIERTEVKIDKIFLEEAQTSVTIPNHYGHAVSIEANVFQTPEQVTEITIPDTIKVIRPSAFAGCSVEQIELPPKVENIEGAFIKCDQLVSISVDPTNPHFKTIDGNLYSKDGTTLIAYAPGKTEETFHIPDGVEHVAPYAFATCSSLKHIVIPESVTSFPGNAVYGCAQLETLEVSPQSSTFRTINGDLYDYSGEKLCKHLFRENESQFIVPASVKTIEPYAFGDTSTIQTQSSIDRVYQESYTTSIYLPEQKSTQHIVLPDALTRIQDNAFSGCREITQITIPDNVTSIGSSAFSDCINLREVQMSDKVQSMGASSFENCYNLRNVDLSHQLQSIEAHSFYHCYSLEKITIPNSVTNINSAAFSYCQSLTHVDIPDSVQSVGYASHIANLYKV